MLLQKQKEYHKLKYIPTCSICGEPIYSTDLGSCEMIKTRRKSVHFVHTLCVLKNRERGKQDGNQG